MVVRDFAYIPAQIDMSYPLQRYTASAHPVESACRLSLLLAICRLIANIKWKYQNNLNS